MFGEKIDSNEIEQEKFSQYSSALGWGAFEKTEFNSSIFNTSAFNVEQEQQKCWNTDPVCRRNTGKL